MTPTDREAVEREARALDVLAKNTVGMDSKAASMLHALLAQVETLEAGLKRIATPEAFYVATSHVDPETYARMIYADKVLAGINPKEADTETEAETHKRYPLNQGVPHD